MSHNYVIPGYILEEEIGAGGSGVVFRAKEESQAGHIRAIKIFRPVIPGTQTGAGERFERELRTLYTLHHRSIISYIGCGFTADDSRFPFIVMDHVDGDSLRKMATSLSIDEKLNIILEIIDALDCMHKKNIFHRDVKPSNIMIRALDKQPMLVDFGLAFTLIDESSDLTNQSLGSPGYVPEEVILNPKRSRGPNHDIYSAGVSLYEILVGRKPSKDNYQTLSLVDNRLVGLDKIVQRALASETLRYQTIDALGIDIRRWMQEDNMRQQLQPSALTNRLRERLIQKQQIEQEEETQRATQRNRVFALYREKDILLTTAAHSAFEELATQLSDIQKLVYEKDAEQIRRQRIDHSVFDSMHINASAMIQHDKARNMLLFGRPDVQPDRHLVRGFQSGISAYIEAFKKRTIRVEKYRYLIGEPWILLYEGRGMAPPQVIEGGIIALASHQDLMHPDLRIDILSSTSGDFTGSGEILKTPQEAKDYLLQMTVKALRLN